MRWVLGAGAADAGGRAESGRSGRDTVVGPAVDGADAAVGSAADLAVVSVDLAAGGRAAAAAARAGKDSHCYGIVPDSDPNERGTRGKAMKRFVRATALAALIVSATVASSGCSYNRFVSQEEAVKAQWSQVENQLQRRN